MSILKVRDKNGEWVSIPAIVGPPGPAGDGTGDMLREIYDSQDKRTDVFAYTDKQIDLHNTAQDAHSDLRSAVSDAQKVADDHVANKSNPHGVTAAGVGAMEQLSANAELSLMGWYKIGYFPSSIYPAQAIVMVGNAFTDSEPHMVTAVVSFAGQYSPNIVVLASNQSGNKQNFTKLRIVKDATANGYALETYYAKDALNMAYVTIVGNVDDDREWTVHAFEPSVAKEAAKLEVTVDKVQSGNAMTDASGVKKSGDTMTGALTLSGNPSSAKHAATKQYVDALKPTYAEATMLASNWSGNTYSFEATYPNAQYNISIEVAPTATAEQFESFGGAMICGSADSNIATALGDVPTVDIPIIIKVVAK